MSKITNDYLTRSGTGCTHSYTHMAAVGVKGLNETIGSLRAWRTAALAKSDSLSSGWFMIFCGRLFQQVTAAGCGLIVCTALTGTRRLYSR